MNRIEKKADKSRILELDYFRFGAALMVLLYHYTIRGYEFTGLKWLTVSGVTQYGYLGVHLFFVISGFVIVMSAAGRDTWSFVKSRVIRLVPMYLVAGLFTFVVLHFLAAIHLLPTPVPLASSKELVTHLLLLHLGPIAGTLHLKAIDGVYWSLGVEGMFYILVAISIKLGWIKNLRPALWIWLAISAVLNKFDHGTLLILLRTLFLAQYAPLFIAGAFFYLIYSGDRRRAEDALALVVSLVVSMWVFGHQAILDNQASKGLYTLSPTVVYCFLVAMFGVFALVAYRVVALPEKYAAPSLGNMTYPLYLIHQFVGYALLVILAPKIGMPASVIAVAVFMCGLSFIANLYCERPLAGYLRSWLLKSETRWKSSRLRNSEGA